MEHFKKILKEKLSGENVSRLSAKLGIPRSVINHWLGGGVPSLKNIHHLKALAEYFSMSLDELLVGEASDKLITSIVFSDEQKKFRIRVERIK